MTVPPDWARGADDRTRELRRRAAERSRKRRGAPLPRPAPPIALRSVVCSHCRGSWQATVDLIPHCPFCGRDPRPAA